MRWPLHLAGTRGKHKYEGLFGGVTAVSLHDFERANGFPNDFCGCQWGAEDDTLLGRLQLSGCLELRRYTGGGYVEEAHAREHAGPGNHELLRSGHPRWRQNGLSQLPAIMNGEALAIRGVLCTWLDIHPL